MGSCAYESGKENVIAAKLLGKNVKVCWIDQLKRKRNDHIIRNVKMLEAFQIMVNCQLCGLIIRIGQRPVPDQSRSHIYITEMNSANNRIIILII